MDRAGQQQPPRAAAAMRSYSLSSAETDMAGLWASGALARSQSTVAAEYSAAQHQVAHHREPRRQGGRAPRISHHGGGPLAPGAPFPITFHPAHHRGIKRASSLTTLMEAGGTAAMAWRPAAPPAAAPTDGAEHTLMYGMLLSEIEVLLQERLQLAVRHRCLVQENSQLAEMVGRLSLALREAQASGGTAAASGVLGHHLQAQPKHHKPPLSRQNSAPARSTLARQGSQEAAAAAASAHAAFLQQQGRQQQQQPHQQQQRLLVRQFSLDPSRPVLSRQQQQQLYHQLVSSSSDSASNASGCDATFSPEDEL